MAGTVIPLYLKPSSARTTYKLSEECKKHVSRERRKVLGARRRQRECGPCAAPEKLTTAESAADWTTTHQLTLDRMQSTEITAGVAYVGPSAQSHFVLCAGASAKSPLGEVSLTRALLTRLWHAHRAQRGQPLCQLLA